MSTWLIGEIVASMFNMNFPLEQTANFSLAMDYSLPLNNIPETSTPILFNLVSRSKYIGLDATSC